MEDKLFKQIKPLWTGLTGCYNSYGKPIPCEGNGQDGEFKKGIVWPKPRFEKKGEVVIDLLTGLIWSANANLYGFPVSWTEAIDYIREMNSKNALGFSSWRLPNRRELRSLLDLGAKNPSLPKEHPFKDDFNGWYWTSTTFAGLPQYAWWIHMEGARMFYGRKDQYAMFWPVTGKEKGVLLATGQGDCFDKQGERILCNGSGQDGEFNIGGWLSEGRFKVIDDLSVLDRLTGLTWTIDANLSKETVIWEEALHLIAEMNKSSYGSKNDWRLPNINELESLVDCSQAFPALPKDHLFKNLQEVYWSSTTSFYETDWAWALYLGKGATGVGKKDVKGFSVWAVRGG